METEEGKTDLALESTPIEIKENTPVAVDSQPEQIESKEIPEKEINNIPEKDDVHEESKISTPTEKKSQKKSNDFTTPQIHISLKTPLKEKEEKIIEIADSLKVRAEAKKTKINNMRLKQKASDIKTVRSVPLINPKSKKILVQKEIKAKKAEEMQNSDDDYHDSVKDYFPESPLSISKISNKTKKLRVSEVISTETLKSTMKLRENLKETHQEPEVSTQSLDITERSKLMSTKKAQKIEEIKKSIEGRELDECTFKPQLISKMQAPVVIAEKTKPASNGSLKKKKEPKPLNQKAAIDFSYRVPPPGSKIRVENSSSSLDSIPIVSERYAQISPFTQSVRYQAGFNYEEVKAKAHQMVDYKLLASN